MRTEGDPGHICAVPSEYTLVSLFLELKQFLVCFVLFVSTLFDVFPVADYIRAPDVFRVAVPELYTR